MPTCGARGPPPAPARHEWSTASVDDVEFILVWLLLSVVVLAAAARAVNVPYPIVLVVGGLALGLVPGLPDVTLDPDLVLVDLPAAAALRGGVLRVPERPAAQPSADLAERRRARAGDDVRRRRVAHALIDGMTWAAAFALGAIVVAHRPGRRHRDRRGAWGLPRRIMFVIEGESLINDGTALVIYRFAVAASSAALLALATRADFVSALSAV